MINVMISVDAGGSSTRYFIIDKNKNVLKQYKTGSGSPAVNENAEEDIFKELELIYEENKNEINLKAIAIGMSGFALVDVAKYSKKLHDRFNTEIILINDADMALYSVLEDETDNGVVVIAGTGAIVLGQNQGKRFYANGWGELLVERGSAYSVVRDFVNKMILHNQELGYYSNLEKKFLKYMNFDCVEDFKMLFYRHGKNEVAKNVVFFKEEANKGDLEAIELLEENGRLLATDVISCLNRTNMDNEFAIGFRGGFIEDNKIVKKTIISVLKEKGYNPIEKNDEPNPIFGGYYIAIRKGLI